MPLFDRYVVVDWSASNRPTTGADSVWIADLCEPAAATPLVNPPTRQAASAALDAIVESSSDRRVLLAVDVALGYPSGAAAAWGLEPKWDAVWAELARLVTDDDRNRNNRFDVAAELNHRAGGEAGPFWGAPDRTRAPALERTRPVSWPIEEFRVHERRLLAAGQRPKSVWQLLGAGSVGSQTLTMVPLLQQLLDRYAPRIEVWPFGHGAVAPAPRPGGVVVVEVWPTQFQGVVPIGVIKDAHQVRATAAGLRAADVSGELARWCSPDLDPIERSAVEREEGWVLGPPV